ncbi:hypothetical protein CCAX7_63490 [Capsulimonas corticalis]|uniref:Uncharacterized protein n=1 Tax=Capsulimonas corticalis TaxID=2219043 RepID=A0A402CWX7_9BACT|nr:sensor domain-containing diguanylate cyclase [Capsulimonas corticalis]BDI34298.1 hypothetical protein CCAX7_63490 [Capsulimonas corticalis]
MQDYHALLRRQLKRHVKITEEIPEDWRAFLAAVNQAYGDSDSSRRLLERAVDLSSAELFESNAELRAILQALPDFLFRIDSRNAIIPLVPSDIDRSDICLRVLDETSHHRCAGQFREALEQIRASHAPLNFEYEFTHDHQEYFYEARLAPFMEAGVIGLLRDITVRKQAERSLKVSEERARLAHLDLMVIKGELEAEQEKLRKLATEDNLTGLWNRRVIFEHLAGDLIDAKQNKRSVAVVMADLDGFKQINDTNGHQVGDIVLQETAKRLKACVRTSDAVGRYGGEEFLIILNDCDGDSAIRRAEELRLAVNRSPIALIEGKIEVTCSFGVSWTRESYYSIDPIVREADTALYQAKHTGKNKVVAASIAY